MKKVWGLYHKGTAPAIHARQCGYPEKFIARNILYTSRAGQWIVKPKDAPELPWKNIDPRIATSQSGGIPVIEGAHLEEPQFFERDYEEGEYQE